MSTGIDECKKDVGDFEKQGKRRKIEGSEKCVIFTFPVLFFLLYSTSKFPRLRKSKK